VKIIPFSPSTGDDAPLQKLAANAVFPNKKSRPLKTSVLMPRSLGHYVPLRFLSERKRSDFLLETTGIATQTALRGATLCFLAKG
jgi:hypothetical protein